MTSTMTAVVKTSPAFGAELLERPVPTYAPDEVLVKVRATSICGTDTHIYKWDAWSEKRIGAKNLPQVLGHEVAGEVVEVGDHVRSVAVGDFVSAETHIYDPRDLNALLGQRHIGRRMEILGVDRDGAFAEYIAVPESVCWVNDPSIPPEYASVQEPLGNATYAVLGEDNDLAGKSIAIVGDGPIALFAVGVARLCGATNIFLVGMSEMAMAVGERMGADHLLWVGKGDHEEYVRDHTRGEGVDISIEMAGVPAALDNALKLVRRGGRFSAFGVMPEATVPLDYNDAVVFKGIQIHGISGRKMYDTWYRVRNFLSSKRLDISPVVTDLLPLEEYEKGFDAMMSDPRRALKVVLFPDRDELAAALARREDA
jgi:threonine 3-dehydrogenase